jgi:hypothetical protein
MRAITSVLSLSVLVPFTSLQAQEPPTIEPGERVRVTAPDFGLQKSVGTCLSLSQGVMAFEPAGSSQLTIPTGSMTGLEISRGRKSNTLKGLGLGFLGGAALGAVIGLLVDEHGNDLAPWNAAVVGAAVFGAGGAVVGAGIGTAIKTDRWEEVPVDRLRVSLTPQRGGRLGIGLSLKF